MLCDFHIHSNYSDGQLSISEIVDLFGRNGFGAIAITDHLCESNSLLGQAARILDRTLTEGSFPLYIDEIREQRERAWKQYGMLLIPGFELTKNSVLNSRSAHMVILGVEEFLSANNEVTDLLKAVREKGGLSIAAHPVCTGHLELQTYYLWNKRRELSEYFDAWEVASGHQIFEPVAKSGLPVIANSDMHHPSKISSYKTTLSCERHEQAIFRAIRQQDLNVTYFNAPATALKGTRLNLRDALPNL